MVLHLCVPKRVKILLILFIMFIVDFDGLIINLFKLYFSNTCLGGLCDQKTVKNVYS